MLILRPGAGDVRAAEITDPAAYQAYRRRRFLALAGAAAATAASGGLFHRLLIPKRQSRAGVPLPGARRGPLALPPPDEALTPYEQVTGYNNFYELATDKYSPARLTAGLRLRPFTVRVEGECLKPRTFDIEELLRPQELEERVYRLRCVEGWSMVIPWIGLPLSRVLAAVQPTSRARFVAFTSKKAKDEMPGQNDDVLPWPYIEGLRIDEAMHPLTFLAVGLYGEHLPGQNGAPLRLVVPWKYGFKSTKAIVRIRLLNEQPLTTWSLVAPTEYGFYANVNPAVSHPRWSQARERRIGELGRRPTLPFNGYGEQVAALYAGQDLKVDY